MFNFSEAFGVEHYEQTVSQLYSIIENYNIKGMITVGTVVQEEYMADPEKRQKYLNSQRELIEKALPDSRVSAYRVGMENRPYLCNGDKARGNKQLVDETVKMIHEQAAKLGIEDPLLRDKKQIAKVNGTDRKRDINNHLSFAIAA
jgi:hypothetical protein